MKGMYQDDMRLTAENSELAGISQAMKKVYPKRGRAIDKETLKNRGKSHVRINRVVSDEDLFMPAPKAIPKLI